MSSGYPNIEAFDPSTCISGKMNRCNRIVANVFRKHLRPFNITSSQASIMFILSKVNDVNQKRLSDKLFLEKSTVNRNIDRLLKNKLIHMDATGILSLTDKGKSHLERFIPQWAQAMKEIREILAQDGEDALNTLIGKLT